MPSTKNPTQINRIIDLMRDGRWLTLGQIVTALGSISEAGCSARLRDCRRMGWTVNKKRIGKNWYAYQLEGIA